MRALAASPDGQMIASASWDGSVGIWPATGGAPRFLNGHRAGVNDVAFGAFGKWLYWTISRDFRAMRRGPVWALDFSPDGVMIYAGGLDDVVYAWPVRLSDDYDPAGGEERTFLCDAQTMPNGERQFMRKCSICYALPPPPSRKAGPTLYGVFGRRAGTVPGYRYSQILTGSDIVWADDTIDGLFDLGPDHYIPGSKMPMQRIAAATDRHDLIEFLRSAAATRGDQQ